MLPDEDVVINLGLRACVNGAEDEKEEEKDKAGTDEIATIGGDFVSKLLNCLMNRARETLGVTEVATAKHTDPGGLNNK